MKDKILIGLGITTVVVIVSLYCGRFAPVESINALCCPMLTPITKNIKNWFSNKQSDNSYNDR